MDTRNIHLGTQRWELFRLKGGALISGGIVETETASIQHAGRAVLLHRVEVGNGSLIDSSYVDHESLAPIAHRSYSPTRTLSLDFHGLRTTGTIGTHGSTSEQIDYTNRYRPFDAGTLNLVLSSLPLSNGFSAVIPMYIHEQGGIDWHHVHASGPRLIRRADGVPVEAWSVEVISESGPNTVHFIDRDNGQNLRTEIGSAIVALPQSETLSDSAQILAGAWLNGAIDAMGGDRLRNIGSIRTEQLGYVNALEQSERPEGPWIKVFQEVSEIRDPTTLQMRRSRRQRSGPWNPSWSGEMTTITNPEGTVVLRNGQFHPPSGTLQSEMSDVIQLAPEQILFTALEAQDLRAIDDTLVFGTRNLRVQFTSGDRRIQVMIDANTMIPHGWVMYGPSSRGFNPMWGDMTLATTWYLWNLHENGVFFPGGARSTLNGQPFSDWTFTSVAFDVP
ncbi:MAG: hypothetical protein OEZ54_12645, partial [Gemmatimonadota bacterium]|nr:hypothetical protein [Gemmatimonadota bacterium]